MCLISLTCWVIFLQDRQGVTSLSSPVSKNLDFKMQPTQPVYTFYPFSPNSFIRPTKMVHFNRDVKKPLKEAENQIKENKRCAAFEISPQTSSVLPQQSTEHSQLNHSVRDTLRNSHSLLC
ncbi:hypothetical protein ILYODFUR_011329 [Ilyodon furcidens]|uniref:Uncharacterized protein n=1 Tax=Ilyodon furcidens TaxID=33524 RepID=A0ABV0UUJ9_9TELE